MERKCGEGEDRLRLRGGRSADSAEGGAGAWGPGHRSWTSVGAGKRQFENQRLRLFRAQRDRLRALLTALKKAGREQFSDSSTAQVIDFSKGREFQEREVCGAKALKDRHSS